MPTLMLSSGRVITSDGLVRQQVNTDDVTVSSIATYGSITGSMSIGSGAADVMFVRFSTMRVRLLGVVGLLDPVGVVGLPGAVGPTAGGICARESAAHTVSADFTSLRAGGVVDNVLLTGDADRLLGMNSSADAFSGFVSLGIYGDRLFNF